MNVIQLDARSTNCALCDKEIPLLSIGGYAVPMYEGKVEYSERAANFPVCKKCYGENQMPEVLAQK